jgi:hypothetical protein
MPLAAGRTPSGPAEREIAFCAYDGDASAVSGLDLAPGRLTNYTRAEDLYEEFSASCRSRRCCRRRDR